MYRMGELIFLLIFRYRLERGNEAASEVWPEDTSLRRINSCDIEAHFLSQLCSEGVSKTLALRMGWNTNCSSPAATWGWVLTFCTSSIKYLLNPNYFNRGPLMCPKRLMVVFFLTVVLKFLATSEASACVKLKIVVLVWNWNCYVSLMSLGYTECSVPICRVWNCNKECSFS